MANIHGVRRQTDGGKIQVRTNGGWVSWGMVSPQYQAEAFKLPGARKFVVGVDAWQLSAFSFSTTDQFVPEPEHDIPDGDHGFQSDPDADGLDSQDGSSQDGSSQDEGENESDSDSDSQGSSGDGAPPELRLLVPYDESADPDCEFEKIETSQGAYTTVKADEALFPSIDSFVTKKVDDMATTVLEVVADGLVAVKEDTRTALEKLEEELVEKIKTSSAATVKIELRKNGKVDLKEGLFHNQFPKLVKYVHSGNHVFLPGPPGTGKSFAAEAVADALTWRFGSISLGPTTPESRLWGGMDAHGKFFEPKFIELARYASENEDSGAVFCMDEMDNGHAGVIATLNSAMANGWFTAPNGDVIRWGSNFVIVAAANTYGTGPTSEFSGRNKLDAATLDRFLYLPWDTDLEMEKALVHAHLAAHPKGKFIAADWLKVWTRARENVSKHGLKVFVTMRGAINGARMLAEDVSLKEAFMAVLGSKLPADQFTKVNPL